MEKTENFEEDLSSFENFLKKTRKSNGEKLLPKTISLYCDVIRRQGDDIFKRENDISSLIDYMNLQIKRNPNIYIKSAFKRYLLFLGLDEDDDRLKLLKSPPRRASVLNSHSILTQKYIREKDMNILLDNLNDKWYLIFKLLYMTGLREDEFLNMRWKDITYVDKKDSKVGAIIYVIGKGSKGRSVFLDKEITNKLLLLRPNDYKDKDKIFLFYKTNGELYKRQEKYLLDRVNKYTKKYLGKKYGVHSLRHSFAMRCSENGGSLNEISSALGHASITTSAIYVKASSIQARNLFEKINKND